MLEHDDDAPIRETLNTLARLISDRIKREQGRNQLTGLSNNLALDLTLRERAVLQGTPFWAAFVEVDKFKTINDRFGYDNADRMLRAVANAVENLAENLSGAVPFHAPGDEFYFVGDGELDEAFEPFLEAVRGAIETLRVEAENTNEKMSCTVSIGWMCSSDIQGVADVRGIKDQLECAVQEAKEERNRVVSFAAEMTRRKTISGRTECAGCGTKFSFDVPTARVELGPMVCPNCGKEIARPSTTSLPDVAISEPQKL